jgi:hypothetical protein
MACTLRSLRETAILASLAFAGAIATPAGAVSAPSGGEIRSVFFSGHSLLNHPVPEFAEKIARSKGFEIVWNRQHIEGSSIKARTLGSGRTFDVREEFARKASTGGYDALIVTEQHTLLGTLIWNDTVRVLKHLADTYAAANPHGRIFLYDSWLIVSDPERPEDWIRYERAARPVWQCIARRLNDVYGGEGRATRIESIPAASALATLLERANAPGGVAGVTAGSRIETFRSLFSDMVHLTRRGNYFISLVMIGFVFDISTEGAWYPEDVGQAAARSLQAVADVIVAEWAESEMSLEACRAYIRTAFLDEFLDYWTRAVLRAESNAVMAQVRKFRFRQQWVPVFSTNGVQNPFADVSETPPGFWLPSP